LGRIRGPSVTVFRPIIYGLTALGLKWRSLLESCGVDPDLLDDSDARIPAQVFDAFWPKAAELTGDPCFGLHLGERVRPLGVNIVGYLLMSSATVREGLERASRFQRVVFDAEWIALLDRGSSSLIRFESENADPLDVAVQTEYKALLSLKSLDWVTASDFRASEVSFRHPPAGERSEYKRIFDCPVTFQCKHNELVVSRWRLDEPSLYGNPEIARVHEEYAQHYLAELEDHSVSRKVKMLLMSNLERGRSDLSETAQSLHMSARTMQRRLAGEGHSYHEILDHLRQELCLEHLEAGDTTLAEIAYLAGFSDASAFSRAVSRWTGQSPLEYRRSHRDSSATL
jgi:AraC-like DNA-binding protein